MTKNVLLIVLALIVAFQALSDSVRDNGDKKLSKLLEGFYILLCLSLIYYKGMYWNDYLNVGIIYVALRVVMIDFIYNRTRSPKLPWFYIGTTTPGYSKAMDKVGVFGKVVTVLFSILVGFIIYRNML